MAILTKTEKYVAETYAKYFGRAANADTIKEYGLKENGKAEKLSVILKNIIAAADAEKEGLSTSEFVNNAFQNLFGRNASTKEMNKYSKVIEKGKDLPINSIVKSATKADNEVYKNKLEVAAKYAELGGNDKLGLDLSKISKGNTVDLSKVETLTDLTNAIGKLAENSGIPSSFDGKPFVLTTGVDAGKDFVGTNKDDQFIADNSVAGTVNASAADTLDGGKGTDTFKLYDAAVTTAATLPTLKNIENVVLYDNNATVGGGAVVDLTKWDTVETLFLVRDTSTDAYKLGEKVTTVNIEDKVATAAINTTLNFDDALAAAKLGLNKVTDDGVAGSTNTITVDGAALKTLTINASGKASDINLTQVIADTIETLNITGRADLTLAYTDAGASKIVTIDGSKAQGKLDLDLDNTDAATLKTVKTGSGNDTVTLGSVTGLDVASGTTINLGAGNDKLVAGAGTIAAGSIIDGGAGIDSLDSTLVTVGNAGVFANFETISLTTVTGTPLDLDLLTKSTITSIAKDNNAIHTLSNVKKSQSLTINTTVASATTLGFKASEIAGTADAYTINFAKDADAGAGTTVDADTVTIDGIETVIVNSTGKTTTTKNIIDLDADAAKSLVITGDKAIDVTFTQLGTAFTGTDGKGVSTIDASASTAGITIGALTVASGLNVAAEGLTIKGGAGVDDITTGAITKATVSTLTIDSGAGNDTLNLGAIASVAGGLTKADINVNAGAGDDIITVGQVGGTFTLGAGKDIITVTNATVRAATDVATGSIKTTITDIEKGDQIVFGAGSTLFGSLDISAANNLDEALDLAAASTNVTTWFQYSGKTYIVDDNAVGALNTADIVVELNGTVNLGSSSFDTTTGTLTIG